MQDDFTPQINTDPPSDSDTDGITRDDVRTGSVVVIQAFDDVPEHLFRVVYIYDDCVGGYSQTGPLAPEYGEPAYDLIKAVHQH